MPAASFSASVSWTVYLAASLALVAVCTPMLSGVRGYSCGLSAAKIAHGVAAVIDGLEPGMTVALSFDPPASDGSLALGGRSLTVSSCGGSSASATRWQLPDLILTAATTSQLRLVGGEVEVAGHV